MKANTNSFKTLSTRLYELLEAERYSESTMRDMRFILHSMSNYQPVGRYPWYDEWYAVRVKLALGAFCKWTEIPVVKIQIRKIGG